jgi:hypothetical protein
VGLLLVLVVTFYLVRWVQSSQEARRKREIAVRNEIDRKQRTVQLNQSVADRMQIYERRALPANLETARTLYQTWLLNSVTEVGFDEVNVVAIAPHSKEGVYQQLAFTVSAHGDLRQLIRFLYKFYSVDYLHRLRRLQARRITDSRQLDLSLSIEALSLPTATESQQLSPAPGQRLAQADLDAYMRPITERNLSGPANHPPTFGDVSVPAAHPNTPLSFTVKGSDPDKGDTLSYRLVDTNLPDASVDAKSGRFQWTPREKGTFEVTLQIADDGLPERSATRTFKIEVTDPPPRTVEPPPSLEQAQFVFLTAITQVGDRRQAWISLRADGKLLRLFEGESFNVGQVSVTVSRIQDKTVELQAQTLEKHLLVNLGQNLAEARAVPASGT